MNRRRSVYAIFASAIGLTLGPAASGEDSFSTNGLLFSTNGLLNGRCWLDRNRSEKLWMLRGMHDASEAMILELIAANGHNNKHNAIPGLPEWRKREWLGAGETYEELIVEMDRIYSDPLNGIIPIVDGCQVAVNMFLGESTSGIQQYLEALRKLYHSSPE
jgi:hypothetical protein